MLILPVANDYNFINHSLSGFINSLNLLGEHLADQIDLGRIVLLALRCERARGTAQTAEHTAPNGLLQFT